MKIKNAIFLYCLLILLIPLIYLCGRFVFESIWYRQQQISQIMWYGANENELFISHEVCRRYIAWWNWEGHSSFCDDEVWLYKYDLKSRKRLWKKTVGVKSRYWEYLACFIVGQDKIFLVRSGENKHGYETAIYDINTLNQVNILSYKTGPVLTFGSQAYKEFSFTTSGDSSYIHWLGNEKDTFIRDEDIQYMKENNIVKVDSKKYDPEKVPPSGVAGTYTRFYYNNNHELRKIIREVIDVGSCRYHLLDGTTNVVLDSCENPGLRRGNYKVYDDTIYSVDSSRDNLSFYFVRRNCRTHTTEKIKLPLL